MPRYFFHITPSEANSEQDWIDLSDLEDAKMEAARLVAEIVRDSPAELWNGELQVRVTDHQGLTLLTIQVAAVISSAVNR
jgi:hypothetical protein